MPWLDRNLNLQILEHQDAFWRDTDRWIKIEREREREREIYRLIKRERDRERERETERLRETEMLCLRKKRLIEITRSFLIVAKKIKVQYFIKIIDSVKSPYPKFVCLRLC